MRISSQPPVPPRPEPTGTRRPLQPVAPVSASARTGQREQGGAPSAVMPVPAGAAPAGEGSRPAGAAHRALSAYGAIAAIERRQTLDALLGVSLWA